LDRVKRTGLRPPTIAIVAALICIAIAVAAGLEGRFSFGGPRWIPGKQPKPPTVQQTVQPHATLMPTAPPHNAAPQHPIVISWLPILVALVLLLLLAVGLLVRYWLRNRRGPADQFLTLDGALHEVGEEVSVVTADLPTLHRGLLRAADILATDREPRDAIVRAWIGLQEAAEDSGVHRRASETPTEFTSRVFESVDADRAAAASLLEVYLRVRFGSAPASANDLSTARAAIERLRETWPVGASA
jgi:hypothetical protein